MRKNNLFQYFEHQDITSILMKFKKQYLQFGCNEECCNSYKLKLVFHHIVCGAQKTVNKINTEVEGLPV